MYILYGASTRFTQQKNKWYFVINDTEITTREEVLAEVWNQKPAAVLAVLANTKSDVAVDFTLKIIDENPHFLDDLSSDIISKLVNHHHSKVITLIVTVLKTKYADKQPEEHLIIGLLNSGNEKALELGFYWLLKYEASYFKNEDFIISLLFTNQVEVIALLSQLYQDEVAYIHKIEIEKLAALFDENPKFSREFLVAFTNLIGNTQFGKLFNRTSATKITELSNSKLVTNKLFAINLAKHNRTPAYKLFKDTFEEYKCR